MITNIQLTIVPGPTLTGATLEKFAEIAAGEGKTADELLAEIITREVAATSPAPTKAA